MTLIKTGAGTQVLTGDNDFTGNVTVSAGRLKLRHSNALGTGPKGLIMQGTGRVLRSPTSYTQGHRFLVSSIRRMVAASTTRR